MGNVILTWRASVTQVFYELSIPLDVPHGVSYAIGYNG